MIARVPTLQGREYELTAAGEAVLPVFEHLGVWRQRYVAPRYGPEHLDATSLLWDMRRRVDHGVLPKGRTVIRFEFSGAPKEQARG